ncbi:MAG: hypothetical protein AB7G06_03415 [Bdellovibrionales bacterium]
MPRTYPVTKFGLLGPENLCAALTDLREPTDDVDLEVRNRQISRSFTMNVLNVWWPWFREQQAAGVTKYEFDQIAFVHDWFMDDKPKSPYQHWLPRCHARLSGLGYDGLFHDTALYLLECVMPSTEVFADQVMADKIALPGEQGLVVKAAIKMARQTDKLFSYKMNGLSEMAHDILSYFSLVAEQHHKHTGRRLGADEWPVFARFWKTYQLQASLLPKFIHHPQMIFAQEAPEKAFQLHYDETGHLTGIKIRKGTKEEITAIVKDWPPQQELDLSLILGDAPRFPGYSGCPAAHASPAGNPYESAVAGLLDMYLDKVGATITQIERQQKPLPEPAKPDGCKIA